MARDWGSIHQDQKIETGMEYWFAVSRDLHGLPDEPMARLGPIFPRAAVSRDLMIHATYLKAHHKEKGTGDTRAFLVFGLDQKKPNLSGL